MRERALMFQKILNLILNRFAHARCKKNRKFWVSRGIAYARARANVSKLK